MASNQKAGHPPNPAPMTDHPGAYTVPTRLYLTAQQRLKLERLLRERQLDMAEVVSEIVAAHLDALPDAPPPPPAPADPAAELRARRGELARLRARRDAAGDTAPAWLHAYIAELEAEIRSMEQG
jgi:hypothetical protein